MLLLAALLQRSRYLKQAGIAPKVVTGFFLLKCAAGLLYTFIALKYIPNRGDIWGYYEDGVALYETLLRSPAAFAEQVKQMFTLTDVNVGSTRSDFLRTAFEGIKFIQFILNLFSFGNIYTNTILFNGLSAWVLLRLWVFLKQQVQIGVAAWWLLLMPSALFYTSGIHKEGIVYILMAILLPLLAGQFRKPAFSGIMCIVLLFGLFFFFKFFVAATFAAGALLWWCMQKWPAKQWQLAAAFVVSAVLFFFLGKYMHPAADLPQYIVNRQQEFLALEAASRIQTTALQPNAGSFLRSLPGALFNALLRPLPREGGKIMYLAFSAEIVAFWGVLVLVAVRARFKPQQMQPVLVGMLLFAGINLLVIGYTIPNIGAMMRYRSIFLPFVGLFFWVVFGGNNTLHLPGFKRRPA